MTPEQIGIFKSMLSGNQDALIFMNKADDVSLAKLLNSRVFPTITRIELPSLYQWAAGRDTFARINSLAIEDLDLIKRSMAQIVEKLITTSFNLSDPITSSLFSKAVEMEVITVEELDSLKEASSGLISAAELVMGREITQTECGEFR